MTADPVPALIVRHQDLCAAAVDPLEIAAFLEARGLTDRMAAVRFRHRDVFSLAEEMYVRTRRAGKPATAPGAGPGLGTGRAPGTAPAPGTTAPAPGSASGPGVRPARGAKDDAPCARSDAGAKADAHRTGAEGVGLPRSALTPMRTLAQAVPGLVCAAAVLAPPGPHWLGPRAAPLGAALVAATVPLALRRGPLRAPGGSLPWGCALAGALVYGEAAALALALAVVPAALCARLFTVRSRARLATSPGLDDFTADVRRLLTGALALYLPALLALFGGAWALTRTPLARSAVPLPGWVPAPTPGEFAQALALGVLLFAARLLAVHGFRGAASAAVGVALAMEASVPAPVLVAAVRAVPVPHGPRVLDALPAVSSALRVLPRLPAPPPSVSFVLALVCLVCAYRALPRVTAHHRMHA